MWRRRAVLIGCLLMAGISPAMATPPTPGTTDSGLNASEEATLWSNASDEYWEEPSANDSVIERLATETDVTFREPPETAARWNRYAHETFDPGDVDTSVHPAEGFTYDGPYIKDAHATIFALTPSTRAFLTTDDERLYVAPEGTLRGAVDYRVDVPDGSERRSWSLRDHGIETVWLFVDDEQTQSASGTHRPTFEYDLDGGQHTVQLEARIEATLKRRFDHRPTPTDQPSGAYTTAG